MVETGGRSGVASVLLRTPPARPVRVSGLVRRSWMGRQGAWDALG